MRSLGASVLVALLATVGCQGQHDAKVAPYDGGTPFSVDPPAVYVAKVKNVLVGLPPTDAEVAAVNADPSALTTLVEQWMALPEYQAKMLVFFELAFQQTQLSAADFTDLIPPDGLGLSTQIPFLLQNLRESFARTVLAFVAAGRPLTDAFTTHELMMTPALMELYAFLDVRHLDDTGRTIDTFATDNPALTITLEASAGPIPLADSVNPKSRNYLHFYDPDVGQLTRYVNPQCNVDPIVMPLDSYVLHEALYGTVGNRTLPGAIPCPRQAGSGAGTQLSPTDFNTWKMVTLRAPAAGEPVTAFYDLPSLRGATELVLNTARVGFFSTPAFAANWPTNQSNQMRVTLNQTLIVATSRDIDGTDTTLAPSTPGLDAEHASSGAACYSCHQLLDPTRSILSSTYSWFYAPQTDPALARQTGLFAFQGVVKPVSTIDDFAAVLATHPSVATGWAQKLCYYMNSTPCANDDPELQRIVGLFQSSGMSFTALVRTLATSPIITHASATATAAESGEVVAVTRRDHLCAALNERLGLVDVCGLDATASTTSVVSEIVSGLPSDGYGRGAPAPILPNQPTLFYRAGLENICEAVAPLVIDAQGVASRPNAKRWSSAQPDAAIADFVSTLLALTNEDARAARARTILRAHFDAALATGAAPTDALGSTFVAACLSPSFAGIGM